MKDKREYAPHPPPHTLSNVPCFTPEQGKPRDSDGSSMAQSMIRALPSRKRSSPIAAAQTQQPALIYLRLQVSKTDTLVLRRNAINLVDCITVYLNLLKSAMSSRPKNWGAISKPRAFTKSSKWGKLLWGTKQEISYVFTITKAIITVLLTTHNETWWPGTKQVQVALAICPSKVPVLDWKEQVMQHVHLCPLLFRSRENPCTFRTLWKSTWWHLNQKKIPRILDAKELTTRKWLLLAEHQFPV